MYLNHPHDTNTDNNILYDNFSLIVILKVLTGICLHKYVIFKKKLNRNIYFAIF